MNIEQNQIIGIAWMVLHCFLISVMSAMVRELSGQFHVFEIVFFHNLVAFILMCLFVFSGKRRTSLKTTKFHLHISRAILGTVSLAMYFYAFTVIPLTEARAIALIGPLVSSLFAVIILKEKTGWHRTLALVIGFMGALIILRPGAAGFSYAALFVVGAVFMWATIDMIIKVMSRTESTATQLFYLTGFMTVLSLPSAIYYWKTPESYSELLWLIGLGAIFLINCMAVFNAYKNADITVVMPFDFSGMVFTTIIAYFAFSEVITIPTAIGSVIIVASSVYIARRESKKGKVIRAVIPQSEE